jgi:lipid-A-disaccharide synthase
MFGIAGPNLRELGVHPILEMEKLQGMGIGELRDLPWRDLGRFFLQMSSYRIISRIAPFSSISSTTLPQPELAFLVDYGGFHLILGQFFRRAMIPIFYLSPPKIWAWGRFRHRFLKALKPVLGVLFPFEMDFYREMGFHEVFFVGHPVADLLGIPEDPFSHRFYLLPGSRPQEWKAHLPLLLEFLPFIRSTGLTPTLGVPYHLDLKDLPLSIPIEGVEVKRIHSPRDYRDGVVAIAASGTVNLELAALGIPHVVFYKPHPFTLRIGRHLVKVPWLNPVNLVAGREILREFLGERAIPLEMIPYLKEIFHRYETIKGELKSVISLLKNPEGFRAFQERLLEVLRSQRA